MDTEKQQHIEDYLADRLSPQARKAFESEMAKDPELLREVELEKELSILGDPDITDFHHKLQQSDRHYRRRNSRRRFLPYLLAGSAAAAAALLIWWQSPAGVSGLEKYFSPYPLVLSQRGVAEDRADLIDAYQNEEWETVIPLLQNWVAQSNDDPLPKLYLGIAELGAGKPENAIARLGPLSLENSQVQEQANWYLALAFWQGNRMEEVNEILENIVTQKAYNFEKAEALLRELK